MLRTRGMNLNGTRAFVKERFQEAGWNRVLARLPRRDVEEVWEGLILPTGWYDYPIHDAFLQVIDDEFRKDVPNLGRELGQRAAQHDIKFHHSLTIAFVDPARVLEQCARLWEEHYSEGRLEVVDRGTRGVKVALTNPGVHPMVCSETVPGWGEWAIGLAGAKNPRAQHFLCVRQGFSRCEYVVEWD
jgi:hypothetical protein